MPNQEQNQIRYTVACVNEFAWAKSLSKAQALHKAFPKDKFSYKDCIFQTFDETEDFMKVLQLKSN